MRSTNPPRCKHCRERTERPGKLLHDHCMDAWIAKQIAKRQAAKQAKQRAAAKVERAQIKARKRALETIPELIKKAQAAFNEFIRMRDRDKGCFVCGRPFMDVVGRRLHAGHVRSRGAAGHLRFTEDNCMGECEGCNGPHGAKPHQIKAGAIARIGADRFQELENDNTPHKWTADELREIAAKYRAKTKELKSQG